jgi:hypothetical protein
MGFDLATVSLVLSGRAASTGPWKSVGLLLLLISAGCYHLYFSKLHLALRDLRPGGIPLSSTLVDEHFANVWRIGKPWFERGSWLMVIGISVLVLTMWRG